MNNKTKDINKMTKNSDNNNKQLVRLQKYLAECGLASRRKCEEYISAGFISVNNKIVTEMGTKVNPGKDVVKYSGNIIKPTKKTYIMLNKPKDYLTTKSDPLGRRTVFDILPPEYKGLHAVGRLDRNTMGMLILTNDGELTQSILHPSYKLPKVYRLTLDKPLNSEQLDELCSGIELDGKKTLPAKLYLLDRSMRHFEIEILEGRNRQVRRMFEYFGTEILTLKRTKIGMISLGKLKLGTYRVLTDKEIKSLRPKK